MGDWNTFRVLSPGAPAEVTERFLALPDFISRIESGLEMKFSAFRARSLEGVRREFVSIKSIIDLSSAKILEIVKSKKLTSWMKSFSGTEGALLVGATATGKTISVYAACQLSVESLKRPMNQQPSPAGSCRVNGDNVHFYYDAGPGWENPMRSLHVTSARELGNLRDHSKLGEDEPIGIRKARTCSLLFIDDLGWERPHQSQIISDVLATRYDNGLPTLSTSGLSLSDLNTRYGDAVMRRMVETSGKRGAIIEV